MNSGCLGGSDGQKSACNAGDPGSSPGWGRSPGEGNGYPLTPVFLSGEFQGQRSLVGYSPRGDKELDVTKRLTLVYALGLGNRNADQSH